MKNIISKVILGSFVVGAVGMANAQKIDAKAKKILDDITANYNSKKNSYFKFSFGSGPERAGDKNGTWYLLCGRRKVQTEDYGY
jgi:hypothetical protein